MAHPDVYDKLAQLMPKDELESMIKSKIGEFHGLLTREIAIRLIAQEKGLSKKGAIEKISNISSGSRRISITGRVSEIFPQVSYKTGRKARALTLSDESGAITLRLWNNDVGRFSTFKVSDKLRITNAYERNGELTLGYNGRLEVIPSPFEDITKLNEGRCNVHGVVGSVDKAGNSISITSQGKNLKCVFGANDGRLESIEAGNEIIIEMASYKEGYLELKTDSRVLTRKTGQKKVVGTRVENETLVVNYSDSTTERLNRIRALNFLGVDVAEDITLDTVLKLKQMNDSSY